MKTLLKSALLIPCYNAQVYLESLRVQIDSLTPQFDQVLLVDDASSDGTYETALEMGFEIMRLERNLGPGGARNALAAATNCEWIHFLDADDRIQPDFLVATLQERPENFDVVLGVADFLDEETGLLLKRWQFSGREFQIDPVTAAFQTPVPLHCSLIRRKKFLEIGGFDEEKRCWEDGDLHLRLAAAGARFHVIPQMLSTSPRHSRGASASHLYCHQCRLKFIEGYIERQISISNVALVDELKNLGYLLLAAGENRLALNAYELAEEMGLNVAVSKVKSFNAVLASLPPRWSHLLSSAAKIGSSRVRGKFSR